MTLVLDIVMILYFPHVGSHWSQYVFSYVIILYKVNHLYCCAREYNTMQLTFRSLKVRDDTNRFMTCNETVVTVSQLPL